MSDLKVDSITQPQGWIDGLIRKYSPNAHDVDCALQNMGLRIEELEAALSAVQAGDEPVAWLLRVKPSFQQGRGKYERAEHRGYTDDILHAGRFTEEWAKKCAADCPDKLEAIPDPYAATPPQAVSGAVSELQPVGFRYRMKGCDQDWFYNYHRSPDSFELRECDIETVFAGNRPEGLIPADSEQAEDDALESALHDAIEMLEEHSASHKDKRCAEYNECDTSPCMWCEKVDAAIPVLRSFKQSRQSSQGVCVPIKIAQYQADIMQAQIWTNEIGGDDVPAFWREYLAELQSALSKQAGGV